jgi:serine/threonine protein kinase
LTRESNRRFHFLREIASGTFGSVYLAKEIHSDGFSRLVAIKLLHRRWSESEEVTRRIRDEARLLGWLRHRNIVDVVDLTAIDGRTAVIMEFLEAADLKHIADHLREEGEYLPVKSAVQIAANVAGALDAAYNRPPYAGEKPLRVIHRDIKPSNVMVDDGGLVKVLDFGVARADFESRESSTADLQFGSVDYMPPERLFFEPETPASDVYSLGATLYEILALERLGKAKGRPDRHAGYLRDRLSFLRAMRGLGGKLATGLERLLLAMLDYEHTERPSAARVVEICRELSKLSPDQGLHDWAEAALPPIVLALQNAPSSESPLDGRMVVEDSSALRVREVDAASNFRAIPEPRFDAKGRPITPAHREREQRMGTAAMEALGAQPPSPPSSAPGAGPESAPTPEEPAAVSIEGAAPATTPAGAVDEVPIQAAPPEDAQPQARQAKPKPKRAPTASFIPRMYATGAFPSPRRGPRGAEHRRQTPPLEPAHSFEAAADHTWDDEQEATALVDPELLEVLKSGKRPGGEAAGTAQAQRSAAPAPASSATGVPEPTAQAAEGPPPPAPPPPPPLEPSVGHDQPEVSVRVEPHREGEPPPASQSSVDEVVSEAARQALTSQSEPTVTVTVSEEPTVDAERPVPRFNFSAPPVELDPALSQAAAPAPRSPAPGPGPVEPVEPVAEPVAPGPEPVEPVAEPVPPGPGPVEPVAEPVAPGPEPVEPAATPVAPAAEPEEPEAQLMQAVAQPLEPSPEPAEPLAPVPPEPGSEAVSLAPLPVAPTPPSVAGPELEPATEGTLPEPEPEEPTAGLDSTSDGAGSLDGSPSIVAPPPPPDEPMGSAATPDPYAFDDDEPTVQRHSDSLPPLPPVGRVAPGVAQPTPLAAVALRPLVAAPDPFDSPDEALSDEPWPIDAAPAEAPEASGGNTLPSLFLVACALLGSALGFAVFMGPARALVAPAPHHAAPPSLEVLTPAAPPSVAEPDTAPRPSAGAPAVPLPPPEPTPALLNEGTEFSVQGDQLRKLMVRCADGGADGPSPVSVQLEAPSACTVTAIFIDRSRATAVLEAAEPGLRYVCFEDGANLCQPR